MQKIQPKGPYVLVGYSYGATIAFEMAIHLQRSHPNTKPVRALILLDGSHAYMHMYRKIWRLAYQVSSTDDDTAIFESEALCAFTMRFANIDYKELREELLACDGWKTRVKIVVEKVMTR